MTRDSLSMAQFLSAIHPYDAMEPAALQTLIEAFTVKTFEPGEEIYALNAALEGLFVVYRGDVESATNMMFRSRCWVREIPLANAGFCATGPA